MKTFLTLFVLFFLVACADIEKGTPRVSGACELVCIGEKNYPSKYGNWRPFYSNDLNTCQNKKNKRDWDSVSQTLTNRGQFICAESWTYRPKGEYFSRKSTACLEWKDEFISKEVEKIREVLSKCDKNFDSAINRYNSIKDPDPLDPIIEVCHKLGFDRGNESNGNCVLKIIDAQNSLNKNSSSYDMIKKQNDLNNSLILMQMGLNLMSSPRPQLNCRFVFNTMQCY